MSTDSRNSDFLVSELSPIPINKIESLLSFDNSLLSFFRQNALELPTLLWNSRTQNSFFLEDKIDKQTELIFYDKNSANILDRDDSPIEFLRKMQESRVDYSSVGVFGIDSYFESTVQLAALKIISKNYSKGVFVQVGGNGTQALKHLILGGPQSILITPSIGEAIVANIGAAQLNLVDRFTCVLGIGESLPIKDDSVDVIYYGGSLHHTNYSLAINEANRVTNGNGIFLALEAIETLGYRTGVRLFKKREPEVPCVILTKNDLSNIRASYPDSNFIFGGFVLRYFFIGLLKLKIKIPNSIIIKAQIAIDGFVGKKLKTLWGSVVLIVIRKSTS